MKLFVEPGILEEIGHVRVAKFLESFRGELEAARLVLPPEPDSTYPRLPEPEATEYFRTIAGLFAAEERLPERLRKAVAALEAAAADTERLDAILQRRIPCVAVNGHSALDRAL